METRELNYHLPADLIAQTPSEIRSNSRLLVHNRVTGKPVDSKFSEIRKFLLPGDCFVLNNTKVLCARFFARRVSGGKIEGLFIKELKKNLWEVMLKGVRKLKVGEDIYLIWPQEPQSCEYKAVFLEKRDNGKCLLQIETELEAETVLEQIGLPPLPPYIKRDAEPAVAAIDSRRYQTVFAEQPGAIAAPTAGLHFTAELIEQLKDAGICFAYITLHIGLGTFKPVTTEKLEEHPIHEEEFSIDAVNADLINATKKNGGRIIAVGTSSVRTLETVAVDKQVRPLRGKTDLFIKPGYEFKFVDAMVTNFHLPKSTLLALVAAFVGLERILEVYNHAISQRYRFYSYGDAMLIT